MRQRRPGTQERPQASASRARRLRDCAAAGRTAPTGRDAATDLSAGLRAGLHRRAYGLLDQDHGDAHLASARARAR